MKIVCLHQPTRIMVFPYLGQSGGCRLKLFHNYNYYFFAMVKVKLGGTRLDRPFRKWHRPR